MRTIAYVRVSTDTQDTKNQRLEVLEYARKHSMTVDDFVEVELSSRKSEKERRIEEILEKLSFGDILITTELSRLGRSTAQVITLVNRLVEMKVRIIILKQGLDIKGTHDMQSKVMVTLFSLFSELERDLISMRTKEALASKRAQGITLGRPRGSLGKSKLDDHQEKIKELLSYQVSKSAISRALGVSRTTIVDYIRTRKIQ